MMYLSASSIKMYSLTMFTSYCILNNIIFRWESGGSRGQSLALQVSAMHSLGAFHMGHSSKTLSTQKTMFVYTCTQNICTSVLPWISENLHLIGIFKLILLLYYKHYKWQTIFALYIRTNTLDYFNFNITYSELKNPSIFAYVFHTEFIQLPQIFGFVVEAWFTG